MVLRLWLLGEKGMEGSPYGGFVVGLWWGCGGFCVVLGVWGLGSLKT